MTVELVDHPWFATSVLRPDQDVLDLLAARAAEEGGRAPSDMPRFLFGYVPVQVFDDLFSGRGDIPDPTARWLLYLSGYFGGRWLRAAIAAAQPEAPLVAFSVEPTAEAFATAMSRAARAVEAAAAEDATVLAFAWSSLLDEPPAEPGGTAVPGLVDSFGYNAGYNLEILAAPPVGLAAAPHHRVSCTGLLRCAFATPRLAATSPLVAVADALNGTDPAYGDARVVLQPLQDAALPRGRSVWSTGLSVQGFDQVDYDQLLEVSSSFLETVQAAALTMVRAHVTADPTAARTGARAAAAMVVWLDAYMVGLLDGSDGPTLPRFVG